MKKHFLFSTTLILAMSLAFTACEKDDNPGNSKSKEELMAQGNWKFNSATVNGNPYNNFASCQTDNVLTFNTAGTGAVDEGSTKCDSGDPQNIPFTWSLITNKTEIQLSAPLYANSATTVTLNSVSESQLIITIPVGNIGPTVFVRVVFVH